MRYFLDVSYKGTAYHGWQNQPNAISVQACVEKALSTLLRVSIQTVGSGRTDTGVHAEQQMVHFDTTIALDIDTYCLKINALLPFDIAVNQLHAVHDDAHARYDAIARSYEYRIVTHKSPFLQNLACLHRLPVDMQKMNEATALLLQYQDFEAFSKRGSSNKHFLCAIKKATWVQTAVGYTFYITANRFLYGMVRTLVGTLLEVGKGKLTVQDFQAIIESKDRTKAGKAAPPEGLFLTQVKYPYL